MSNVQRHFKAHHPDIEHSAQDNPTPAAQFDLETFIENMVTWIVADDQV
jgi:hypothetical protein